MPDPYRLVHHPNYTDRMEALSRRAAQDVEGRDADVVDASFKALDVLAQGRERDFSGERLSFSPNHYDLRDCAEIKIAVFDEYTRAGKPRGPSHRMIYREYHGTADDARPIREVMAFEHRAGGLPYAVVAAAIGRQKGRPVDALRDLPAPKPVLGPNKDPHREITPPRLPLPPDIAAALGTASRRPPGRPTPVRPAPARRAARATSVVQRDHH